jgi:hypothetical protein
MGKQDRDCPLPRTWRIKAGGVTGVGRSATTDLAEWRPSPLLWAQRRQSCYAKSGFLIYHLFFFIFPF